MTDVSAGRVKGEAASVVGAVRYPRYPAYKNPGVEWLGEIPTHWDVKRLKVLATVQLSGIDKKSVEGQDVVRLCNYLDVYYNEKIGSRIGFMSATATPEQVRRFSLRSNDVMITKDSEAWTDIAVPAVVIEDLPGVLCGYHLAHIRPYGNCDGTFLSWSISAIGPRDQYQIAANGITRFGLTSNAIRDGIFAIPTPEEQHAISTFLNGETAKIDALVARKQRLIELLKEKRAALITRAVTKGLDPDAPMKDSGVEWMGEIPAHWRKKKLKRWASVVQTGSTPPTDNSQYFEEGTVPWHGPSSFSSELLLRPATRKVAESAIRDRVARIFDKGSTMIVTIGATIGRVGFIDKPSSCNQQITAVTFNSEDIFPKYAGYQMKRFEPILAGIAPSTTLPILDQGQIGYLPLLGPSIGEQRAIADYLDRETAKIDALVAKVREAIDRLKELRIALISAAVTGKIDVREAAA